MIKRADEMKAKLHKNICFTKQTQTIYLSYFNQDGFIYHSEMFL